MTLPAHPFLKGRGSGDMGRGLRLTFVAVGVLLASCNLARTASPEADLADATATHVAELNLPARQLTTAPGNIWDSFDAETPVQSPTAEDADKAFQDLDPIATSKDTSKLGEAEAGSDPLGTDTGNRDTPNAGLDSSTLPTFTLSMDANCRKGPSKQYGVVTSALSGRASPIAGRSEDGYWYLVQLMPTVRCWFASAVGAASGDLSQLKVSYGPPLPTATQPISCSSHKDKPSCEAEAACRWAFAAAGPGYCTAK